MLVKTSKRLLAVVLATILFLLPVCSASATASSADAPQPRVNLLAEWQSWPNIYSGRRIEGYIFVIQRFLSSYDYTAHTYLGNVDGTWGPKTEKALKYYQGQKGLTQDAQCGTNTWTAMYNDCVYAYHNGEYIFMSYADMGDQIEICRRRSDGSWWTNNNSYCFRG